MKKNKSVVLAQINTIVGDFEYNFHKIEKTLFKARTKGGDFIIFPELTLCGYPPEDLLLKPKFIQDNLMYLEKVANLVESEYIVVGYADQNKNKIYNALAVLHDHKIIKKYYKNHLPNYSVFDEKRYFQEGNELATLNVDGIVYNLTICEDLWVKNGPADKLKANIVLNISSSPFYLNKLEERIQLLCDKAKKNKTYIFYCNLVGGQDELVFDGSSMIISPDGKILAMAKQFKEDMLYYELNFETTKRGRIESTYSKIEQLYKALVLGVHDYVKKNNFKKVVIGSSGGIDSAVVLAITKEALGAENVMSVTMPSQFSSKETYSDAVKLSKNLHVPLKIFPIKSVYDEYMQLFKKEFEGLKFNTAEENLQARIRGNILMALSNKYNWLVLITGNKSEMSVGYSTIYGDMAGGFGVIKDVYKTSVYELARYINREKEIIPNSIINRPPSAELRPDQKDQDSLPPYELLDKILEEYIEKDKTYREICQMGFDKELVRQIVQLVDRNEYKRRQAPIGIKITPKAFGKDRRMPIVNHYI